MGEALKTILMWYISFREDNIHSGKMNKMQKYEVTQVVQVNLHLASPNESKRKNNWIQNEGLRFKSFFYFCSLICSCSFTDFSLGADNNYCNIIISSKMHLSVSITKYSDRWCAWSFFYYWNLFVWKKCMRWYEYGKGLESYKLHLFLQALLKDNIIPLLSNQIIMTFFFDSYPYHY